jgi:hypothetical protein
MGSGRLRGPGPRRPVRQGRRKARRCIESWGNHLSADNLAIIIPGVVRLDRANRSSLHWA